MSARLLLTVSAALLGCLSLASELKEGSAAPVLSPAKWVKGGPVKNFEAGKVYVVEFWATWCGPCKESIPHLTELAHQFKGKVTFIGVDVWDKDDDPKATTYVDRVAKWVKAKGNEMDYNVCVDDVDDTMSNTWMKAAGQNGIPAAFVVDQKGTIAWIGHPMAGLDKVLAMVTDGKFTPEAAAKMREEEAAKAKQIQDAFKEAHDLVVAGKVDEGFAKLDAIGDIEPAYKKYLPISRFQVLCEADEAKGQALGKKYVTETYKDDMDTCEAIGMYIAMGYIPLKNPDYDLAIQALAKVSQAQGDKVAPSTLMGLAQAYSKKGNKAEAVTTLEKAIALARKDPGTPEKAIEMMEKTLESIKKG